MAAYSFMLKMCAAGLQFSEKKDFHKYFHGVLFSKIQQTNFRLLSSFIFINFYHCIQFSIFLLSFYLIDVSLSKMGHITGVYQACCTESGYVQGKKNFRYFQW